MIDLLFLIVVGPKLTIYLIDKHYYHYGILPVNAVTSKKCTPYLIPRSHGHNITNCS